MTRASVDEPFPSIWRRRVISIPGLIGATALSSAATPFVVPVLAGGDLLWRWDRRLPAVRAWLALVANLYVHTGGLGLLGVTWFRTEVLQHDPEADARETYRIEGFLSRSLLAIVETLFDVEVEVEGLDCLGPEPSLILARHASVLDPILVLALTEPSEARVRWVAKRELLWDPCIDVMGHRIPTAFVWRRGRARAHDLEAVASLADHLEPDEAVLIFPEGTRFSEEKRAARIAELEAKDPALADRARALKHVLPPRPSGTLALLHRDHDDDVVILAHTGLEGLSHLQHFFDGKLIGARLRVKLWRVPRHRVPDEDAAVLEWLWSVMEEIDAWIEAQQAPT